jgi:hypothetical protein
MSYELYIKTDESKIDKENIFKSTLISRSKIKHYLRTEFNPYVSMIIRTVYASMSNGFPQIQSPFVQGIVLGPIANPVILFNNLFERKDFPDLCGPATLATAI